MSMGKADTSAQTAQIGLAMSVKANVCLFAPQSEYQYHFNELLQLYSSFFSFCWLFSTYESKSAFFDSLAVLDNTTKPTAKENANAFLDRALRGRSIVIEAETNRLTSAGENGGLSKKTTDEEIENYAAKMGYHHQATSIVQGASRFWLNSIRMEQHTPSGTVI
jgi:KaiC/GvpD/RAD55 family RecA-like ATPase